MPTEKADMFTIAKFGELADFKKTFKNNLLNVKSDVGSGLLHYAVSGSKFDIAQFLIDRGIDVNMKNADGQTVLHLISVNQDINVAKSLLQNGVDVNARDKFGNNALWSAVFNCKGRKYDMVNLLMKYRADPLNKNNAGRSPLDFATQVGNGKLVDILRG